MTRPPARNGASQIGESLHRRVGPQELVALGDLPPVLCEDAHGDDRLAHDAVRPRRRRAVLRAHGECIRVVLRQVREAVVQVLRGCAHRCGGLVDDPLRDEARVEVDVLAHRVMAHVLDAAREDDVCGAPADLARARGDGRERAGAHPVDGEAGHGLRDPGEEPDVAAEREPLVADLCGRGHDHVADPLRRDAGVSPQELADGLDGHVVCPRPPEEPLRARLSEGRPDAVDVVDLAHEAKPSPPLTDRSTNGVLGWRRGLGRGRTPAGGALG